MPELQTDSGSTRLEIAHVLFMDIVAYSRLPMDQQQQALLHLQEAVRTTKEFERAQARGRLISLPTGDGMALVFLGDVEAPVRCALELYCILRRWPEMQMRMGIHTGPVYRVQDINAALNVAGGGINVAQRVMDCGDGGHILISKTVADVLDQVSKWKAALHDLGEAEVKHGFRVHLYNLYTDEAGNRELPQKLRTAQTTAATARSRSKIKKLSLGVVAAGVIAALAAGSYFHLNRSPKLTDKDTIVLADFTNTTGDVVFDGTLRQGLAVQLEQSPFLSLVSEQRVQQTLRLMGQPPDTKLTPQIAWEVCQRTGGAAVLNGSIAQVEAQYLLTLKAVNCVSGESLASTVEQASDRNHVLDALGKIASEIRNKLGESINSIQKFDTPLEQATTPSLEALQAYSLGRGIMNKGESDPIPHFRRAIELDQNFAIAYATLGFFTGRVDYLQKAYALRDRVSEREKFYIEAHYFDTAIGNLEKARQVYELWMQTYPRDWIPHSNLARYISPHLGQYVRALDESRQLVRISPDNPFSYECLVVSYLNLNRFEEARIIAQEAKAKNLDSRSKRYLYRLAFLQNDAGGMEEQLRSVEGKPGVEGELLSFEANTDAYSGRLGTAREFSQRAAAAAEQAGEKEDAASYEAQAALREALFRNATEARRDAASALGLSADRDGQGGAAVALALAGDAVGAQAVADGLGKRFPEDTIVQFNYLPTVHAQIALSRNDASKAIEVLQAAAAYDMGTAANTALYPIFVRGEAYLAAHQRGEAAAAFQKILDHRGIVINEPIGALAHLGLARAYALSGDTAKAKSAYQNFLTLWKDADPDIPILKQAKAEYAKLQ
jgi:eukaryotic-like serine/threonine-protein kinase